MIYVSMLNFPALVYALVVGFQKFIRLTSRGSAPTEWKKMNFFSVTFPDVFILAMVIDINGDPPGEGIDIHIKNVPLFD